MKKRKKLIDPAADIEDPIDLTPMVNVALILVVVFLCVSPMTLLTGIKATSSGTGSKSNVSIGKTTKKENVRVYLDKDGEIFINEKNVKKKYFVAGLREAINQSATGNV